jgi:cytochrome c551/c552
MFNLHNQQVPMPPQPTIAEAQAKRKALTDAEAQQK